MGILASLWLQARPNFVEMRRGHGQARQRLDCGELAPAFRACFKIERGPAARDFGRSQGGEARASPQRAVRAEPTPAATKRPAALRVFAEKAAWLRCSSVTER